MQWFLILTKDFLPTCVYLFDYAETPEVVRSTSFVSGLPALQSCSSPRSKGVLTSEFLFRMFESWISDWSSKWLLCLWVSGTTSLFWRVANLSSLLRSVRTYFWQRIKRFVWVYPPYMLPTSFSSSVVSLINRKKIIMLYLQSSSGISNANCAKFFCRWFWLSKDA